MSHKSFCGKQICNIYVKMRAKSVAERMTGQSFGASKPPLMSMNVMDKTAQFCPENIFRSLVQNIREIRQIRFDISGIRQNGMVYKTAEGDHFPVLF